MSVYIVNPRPRYAPPVIVIPPVERGSERYVEIRIQDEEEYSVWVDKSEIPALIKALQEVA